MIGKIISHYKILEKLGEGGMGVVYKAEDLKLKRTVTLKFLPPELTRDPEAKERFVHEAQAASALQHNNICTIHEIDETDDSQMIICMDYYTGETIKEKIEQGLLNIEEAIDIAVQVAQGLAKAHRRGIIHRDIKPANIMITDDGVVKILDFGLAKLAGQVGITKTGVRMGTVAYMSPEQARGEAVDHRTDIWSLGVVLYEMLTGQIPFKGEYEQAVVYSILNEESVSPSSIRKDTPKLFEQIVSKCLEKDPAMRYQNMQEVLEELKKPVVSAAISRIQKKSIAVLSFTNMSADPEQEYFCDGMAEEIINALTHIESLKVIARTSAFAFKGKHEDVRKIGKKLNVETLLEGSVRKAGNRLRITAQLVKVCDGSHFWSERYDRDMEDVFAIQDEISLAIVDKLKGRLLGEEKAALVKRYTENLEAYNLYLKGNYFSQMWTVEGFEKAIECLEQALQKDPNYALAYAGIAYVYFFRAFFGNFPPKEAIPKAKTYLKKALDIDENLAEAHALLGKIRTMYDWNWVLAEQELKLALELNPNSSIIHLHYCDFLSVTGQHEEAIIEVKRARELDPLSININANVGERMYFAGQFDRAIEDLQKTIAMDRNWFYSHLLLGLSYLGKSMLKESIVELEKASDLSGGAPLVVVMLASTYYRTGKKTEAEKLFNSLKERAKDEYIPPSFLFVIHKVRGDMELAFKWLERACEDRDIYLPYYLLPQPEDHLIIPYDKKSTELLRKVGLIK